MVLTLLAILIAALLVLAVVCRFLPAWVVTWAKAAIVACIVILVLLAMALGSSGESLALPSGQTGLMAHLALGPLATPLLLLLFIVLPCGEATPVLLASMAVILLAGDSLTLAIGLLLLGGATSLRTAAASTICLILALALASPTGVFEMIQTAPPEGWRAAAILVLVLAGTGMLARLSPPIAVYLLVRILFDLSGAGQPLWWSIPILLLGPAIAMHGPLRATLADTLPAAASALSWQPLGMAISALGLALLARSVDLPSLTSLSLQSLWLALVTHVLCRTLLLQCSAAIEAGAGTDRLDRLGGAIHRMPITACCCLIALYANSILPLGLGFAAFWLLFQCLLAAARIGGLGLQVLIAGMATLAACSIALSALSSVRLFGVAFLGRPRTPRAAVAEELPRRTWAQMAALAALTGVVGLFPALALLPADSWTHGYRVLVTVRTSAETPGYAPLMIVWLLALVGLGIVRFTRRRGDQRREPAWSGGFAAPPPWLPFGDPATQYGPASFAEPLQRVVTALPSGVALRRRYADARAGFRRIVVTLVPP